MSIPDNFLIYQQIASEIVQLSGVISAIPEEDHVAQVGTSDYPIETGATLTDHAFIKPIQLTITGLVSSLFAINAGSLVGTYRDKEAWQQMLQLLDRRSFVTAVTTLAEYENMIIESIEARKNSQEGIGGLRFSMQLKQVLVANTQSTRLPSNQISGAATNRASTINGGDKQSATSSKIPQSWLSQL